MRLCLNMIVKNEVSNLRRCLSSVLPYISCYVIADTGSTDNTPAYIRNFFDEHNIPGQIVKCEFKDFSQARNFALDAAVASPLEFDYLLFTDADMELIVEGDDFRKWLTGPAYALKQRQGTMIYDNTRIVRRDAGACYYGVTHEYVGVEGCVPFKEPVWFLDHATGSNRPEKGERDTRLLEQAVKDNPDDLRAWFYLGQTYKGDNRFEHAITAYSARLASEGWDEEKFYALYQRGLCYLELGDEEAFVREMMAAYQFRPSRGEPLFSLAKFYRAKGQSALACLFIEAGSQLPPPADYLFVDEYAHKYGFKTELAISGYYLPRLRQKAFDACDEVALSRDVTDFHRGEANNNIYHFLPKLEELARSTKRVSLSNPSPIGYRALNPSITTHEGRVLCNIRTVNYSIDDNGCYDMHGDNAIRTDNWLVDLDIDMQQSNHHKLKWDRPAPAYHDVLGMEDVRIFSWCGELWSNSCIREQSPMGYCEQMLARIDRTGVVQQWSVMRPPGAQKYEKNWSALIYGGMLWFMYRPGLMFDPGARRFQATEPPKRLMEQFSGSTQCVMFDGGWLTVIHEARMDPNKGYAQRFYTHRFLWLDHAMNPQLVSKPFCFNDRQIEFAAGMCKHPLTGELLISYGVRDREAWVARINPADVRELLR